MKTPIIATAIALIAIASSCPAIAATNYDSYGNSIGNAETYFRNGAGIATPASPSTPLPVTSPGTSAVTQQGVTIAATNTFQQILAANPNRTGCLIQNNSTHPGYVFTATGSPTLANSLVILPGGTYYCENLQTAITWAGTAGDAIVIVEAQ